MEFRVTEDWQATYANPLRVRSGDPLHLTGREDDWDGHIWLWARSTASGLEGWIPDSLVLRGEGGTFAAEEYSAAELTCRAGQVVGGEREQHGWVYCRTANGDAGWVPRRHLAPLAE